MLTRCRVTFVTSEIKEKYDANTIRIIGKPNSGSSTELENLLLTLKYHCAVMDAVNRTFVLVNRV